MLEIIQQNISKDFFFQISFNKNPCAGHLSIENFPMLFLSHTKIFSLSWKGALMLRGYSRRMASGTISFQISSVHRRAESRTMSLTTCHLPTSPQKNLHLSYINNSTREITSSMPRQNDFTLLAQNLQRSEHNTTCDVSSERDNGEISEGQGLWGEETLERNESSKFMEDEENLLANGFALAFPLYMLCGGFLRCCETHLTQQHTIQCCSVVGRRWVHIEWMRSNDVKVIQRFPFQINSHQHKKQLKMTTGKVESRWIFCFYLHRNLKRKVRIQFTQFISRLLILNSKKNQQQFTKRR